MSRTISTSVLIAAPRTRVWSVLMDFPRYPEWNPFIRSIKGKAEVGQRLEAVIQPPGRKADTFRPVILELEPDRIFKWRGSLAIPGMFTGEHSFQLRDEGAGTRFEHGELFTGLLVPFVGSVLDASEKGFHRMNEAIKLRSEG